MRMSARPSHLSSVYTRFGRKTVVLDIRSKGRHIVHVQFESIVAYIYGKFANN
jgi:hypothetical protein